MGQERIELTHDDIWDDSALVDSWNEALDEYKVRLGCDLLTFVATRSREKTYMRLIPPVQKYHSIHASGGKLEDLPEYVRSPGRARPGPCLLFPPSYFFLSPLLLFRLPSVANCQKRPWLTLHRRFQQDNDPEPDAALPPAAPTSGPDHEIKGEATSVVGTDDADHVAKVGPSCDRRHIANTHVSLLPGGAS